MKKNIFALWLLMMCPMLAWLSSCDNKDEIVFDHELPQFEVRDDAILLEVIMPQGTTPEEEIFIVGAFNGGEEVASQDLKWQLEKASGNDIKWGIYLYPEDFVEGKTLADGFYFVSRTQGVERTLTNEDAHHALSVKVGSRTNVTVSRWNAYFEEPEEPETPEHDGYVIYVIDRTGWEATTLYAWGDDLPELFGAWPGIQPTGTAVVNGVTVNYYDTGADNEGLTYNLIFNNNNGEAQFDGLQGFVLNRDLYLEITDKGFVEIGADALVSHDGYAIFVEDGSGWEETAVYVWGDAEIFGAWPGALPAGTATIDGVTYKYYDTGADNTGKNCNLIMNNNNGGEQFDLATIVLDRNYYYKITDTAGEEVNPYAAIE